MSVKKRLKADKTMQQGLWHGMMDLFVDILRPNQLSGVMSSAVSLPNHYWAGLVLKAVNKYSAHSFTRN